MLHNPAASAAVAMEKEPVRNANQNCRKITLFFHLGQNNRFKLKKNMFFIKWASHFLLISNIFEGVKVVHLILIIIKSDYFYFFLSKPSLTSCPAHSKLHLCFKCSN